MAIPDFRYIQKSPTSLRITSDLKEKKELSLVSIGFGLLSLFGLFYRDRAFPTPLTATDIAFLLSVSGICFLIGLVAWFCQVEIEFNAPQRQIMHRYLCVGRVWRQNVLPFARLHAILLVENDEGGGELRLNPIEWQSLGEKGLDL